MRKVIKNIASALAAAALSLGMLCGCSSSESSNAPTITSYDTETGEFSFETVEGGDTYVVGVSRVINDTTGAALEEINGASEVEVDGVTYYVWSEQTGSVSGLTDTDGDGVITGTVVYREYSSSAEEVGDVKEASDIPVGTYILSVVPASTDELTDPETAYYIFTIDGELEAPSGFTATINDSGYMEITAASSYFLNALTVTGLPESITYDIYEDGELVETITLDDFSYTNTVNGPSKGFTFNNATVTGTVVLDTSAEHTVTVTAVGDGDTVTDASAEAYIATTTEAPTLAETYGISASTTAGDYTISLTFGTDSSGAETYVLSASVSNVVIYYETGTVSSSDEVGTYDDVTTYPEGATLTLTATSTDADTAIFDGTSLTVTVTESMDMWSQQTTISYSVSGSASLDGETITFGATE